MTITNHRLDRADFVEAAFYGGTLDTQLPLHVIAHDTAGRSATSTVNYLAGRPAGKVSYHAIIHRDGAVTQMVPFNRVAHHAGVSRHPSKPWLLGLNRCSIGLAFENPGALDDDKNAWFGVNYPDAVQATRDGQTQWYVPYTQLQRDVFEILVEALDQAYGLDGVFSHYQVATPVGRKTDTNPTLDRLLGALNHRVEDKQDGMPLSERAVVNAAGGLHLRAEPYRTADIIETMPLWTGVNVEPPALANGYALVTTDQGQTGWCHTAYLQGA